MWKEMEEEFETDKKDTDTEHECLAWLGKCVWECVMVTCIYMWAEGSGRQAEWVEFLP